MMASFKLLIAVIAYCLFSFTMSQTQTQTSREYRNFRRKLNRMRKAFEAELNDLKSEFQTEKIKVEDLRKQLLGNTYRAEGANREDLAAQKTVTEPGMDRVGLAATPIDDEVNKLNERITMVTKYTQDIAHTVHMQDELIQSLQNHLTVSKRSLASTAAAVGQIQEDISNKSSELSSIRTLVTEVREERIKRKQIEEELKQSINITLSQLEFDQARFRNEMSITLSNATIDINTTVEASKEELFKGLSALANIIVETELLKTKMNKLNDIGSSAESLLCGNGFIKHHWNRKTPTCQCQPGYSGVHCEIKIDTNTDEDSEKPAAHLMGSLRKFTQPQVPGKKFPVPDWISNEDLAFTNNVRYRYGRIVIKEAGLYYVYSQLSFLQESDTTETSPQSLSHYMYRFNIVYPGGGEEEMIQSANTNCWGQNKASGEYTSYLGAVFHLRQGDELFVKVSNLTSIVRDPKLNYFGLFKVN